METVSKINILSMASLEFCLVYATCILTPIHIMIDQDFLSSSFSVALLVCDFAFFCKFCVNMYKSKRNRTTEILTAIVGFPSIIVLPLGYVFQSPSRFLLWISAVRMFELFFLAKMFSRLQTSLELASSFNLNETAIKATQVVLYTILYASTLACVWFYISCTNRSVCKNALHIAHYYDQTNNPHSTWIIQDDFILIDSVTSCYFRSMHYVTQSLLTVGYGDIHPVNSYEMAFSLYILINGTVFYGFLISSITSLLASRDITAKTFRSKLNYLKEYLKIRISSSTGVTSSGVKEYMLSYFEYQFTRQCGVSEREILSELPLAIVREIKSTHSAVLKRVPFFAQQSDFFIELCCQKLFYRTYCPDTAIKTNHSHNHSGNKSSCSLSSAAELIVLISGKVDVFSKKTQKSIFSFVAGDVIAEFDFLFQPGQGDHRGKSGVSPAPHVEYDLLVTSYTNTVVLSYVAFCDAVNEYCLLVPSHSTASSTTAPRYNTSESTRSNVNSQTRYSSTKFPVPTTCTNINAANMTSCSCTTTTTNRYSSINLLYDSHHSTPAEDFSELCDEYLLNRLDEEDEEAAAVLEEQQRESEKNSDEVQQLDAPETALSSPVGSARFMPLPGHRRSVRRSTLHHNSFAQRYSTSSTATGGMRSRQSCVGRLSTASAAVTTLSPSHHTSLGRGVYTPLSVLEGLAASYSAHQHFQQKLSKAQTTMEQTFRTKRIGGMMETYTPKSSGRKQFVVLPSSPYRLVWSVVMLAIVLYYNLAVPLRIMINFDCSDGNVASGEYSSSTHSSVRHCLSLFNNSLAIDYLCDAIFLLDLALHSRYFAFRKFNGDAEVVETDREAIYSRFRQSSRFFVDILIALPVDLFAFLTGYLLCWRLLKLVSLLLLPELVSEVQSFLERERGITVGAEAVTVTHLVVCTGFVATWVSVCWAILRYEGDSGYFMSAFYWTFTTMTTTGYGDIVPETTSQTAFTVVICFLGPSIFATIIGKFASYVKKVNVSTDNPEHRLVTIKQFLKSSSGVSSSCSAGADELSFQFRENDREATVSGPRSLLRSLRRPAASFYSSGGTHYKATEGNSHSRNTPHTPNSSSQHKYQSSGGSNAMTLTHKPSTRHRDVTSLETAITEYYDYLESGGADKSEEATVLKHCDMPSYIEDKLRIMVVEDLVLSAKIFAPCTAPFTTAIMLALTQLLFAKKSLVVDGRGVAEGMFFIKTGIVKIRESSERRFHLKYPGECFAEHAILGEGQAASGLKYEIIATTDCELWFLSRAQFNICLRRHPVNHAHMPFIRGVVDRITAKNRHSDPLDVKAIKKIKASHKSNTRFILTTTSTVYQLWSLVVVGFTIYNLLMLPLRIAYYQNMSKSPMFYADYTGDVVFLCDIILRCSCLAYADNDEVVTNRYRIFTHYLLHSSENKFHIAAALPLDLLLFATGNVGTLGEAQTMALLRLNKLLRLCDVHLHMAQIESAVVQAFKERWGVKANKNAADLSKLILVIVTAAYVFGALFFVVASQAHLRGHEHNWADVHNLFPAVQAATSATTSNSTSSTSFTVNRRLSEVASSVPSGDTIYTQCVYSLYWAMAVLTTAGYGDVSPVSGHEMLYNILLFVLGTLIFATVIVHLQDIVSQLDTTSDIFKLRLHRVTAFLLSERTDAKLVEKVHKYYNKLWTTHRGATGSEIQSFIPPRYYLAALYGTARQPLNTLFFVNKCSKTFQHAFISKMIVRHYLAGDYLFRAGEAGCTLFLLHSGEVSLVSYDSTSDTATSVENAATIASLRRTSVKEFSCDNAAVPASHKNSDKSSHNVNAFQHQQQQQTHMDLLKSLASKSSNERARRKKRSSYCKVNDGFIGESEFFSRSPYACSAHITADSVLYEIDFDAFWSLVLEHKLANQFSKTVNKENAKLHRNSTLLLVQKMTNNMNNRKMAKMASIRDVFETQHFCILPDSYTAHGWNALALLLLLMQAIFVPYFIAFPASKTLLFQQILDILYVVFFSLDIYARLYWFAVVEDGNVVSDPAVFRSLYAQQYLSLDLLSTFPVALIFCFSTSNVLIYRYLRVLHLIRMCKLLPMLSMCCKGVENALGIKINVNKLRVAYTLMIFLYITHIVACGFCYVGMHEMRRYHYSDGGNGSSSEAHGWIFANNYHHMPDDYVYLRAYYWALYTLTTVGYGSIAIVTSAERLFALCCMVLGGILTAALSAMLSSIVESADTTNSELRRSLEATLRFCQSNLIETATQDKVTAYFKYLGEHCGGPPEQKSLFLLPAQLKSEFVLDKTWRSLRKISFLDERLFDKQAQNGFIATLVRHFEVHLAIPGEALSQIPLLQLLEHKRWAESAGRVGEKFDRCARDLLVLRRGSVYATIETCSDVVTGDTSCCGVGSVRTCQKQYFKEHSVVDLMAVKLLECLDKETTEPVNIDTLATDNNSTPLSCTVSLQSVRIRQSEQTVESNVVVEVVHAQCLLDEQRVMARQSEDIHTMTSQQHHAKSTKETDLVVDFAVAPLNISSDGTSDLDECHSSGVEVSQRNHSMEFDIFVGHTKNIEYAYHLGRATVDVQDLMLKAAQQIQRLTPLCRQGGGNESDSDHSTSSSDNDDDGSVDSDTGDCDKFPSALHSKPFNTPAVRHKIGSSSKVVPLSTSLSEEEYHELCDADAVHEYSSGDDTSLGSDSSGAAAEPEQHGTDIEGTPAISLANRINSEDCSDWRLDSVESIHLVDEKVTCAPAVGDDDNQGEGVSLRSVSPPPTNSYTGRSAGEVEFTVTVDLISEFSDSIVGSVTVQVKINKHCLTHSALPINTTPSPDENQPAVALLEALRQQPRRFSAAGLLDVRRHSRSMVAPAFHRRSSTAESVPGGTASLLPCAANMNVSDTAVEMNGVNRVPANKETGKKQLEGVRLSRRDERADIKKRRSSTTTAVNKNLSTKLEYTLSSSSRNSGLRQMVTIRAENYCHLFRVPVKKLQELQQYYRLSTMSVTQRITALPKEMNKLFREQCELSCNNY